MKEKVRKKLVHLYSKSIFIGFALLALMIMGSLIAGHAHYTSLAEGYSEITRKNLLLGDYRESMLQLNSAIVNDFQTIKYFDFHGDNIFTLGDKAYSNYKTISIRSVLSESSKSKLQFMYDPWSIIFKVTAIWIIISMINVPIIFVISRKQKAHFQAMAQMESLAQIGKISRQVAHDIRSPLSALKILSQKVILPHKKEKDILDKIILRMEGIADDVLNETRADLNQPGSGAEGLLPKTYSAKQTLTGFNAIDVISELVNEKKISYPQLKVLLYLTKPIEVMGCKVEFSRIVSNILNNSIEASLNNPKITISTENNGSNYLIEFRDQGKGIPKELLKKVSFQEISIGKQNGNGVGLVSARKSVESWGGQFSIASKIDIGTTISILLPKK